MWPRLCTKTGYNKNGKFVAHDCRHMGMFFGAAFVNKWVLWRFCEICNETQEELGKWLFVGTLQKKILLDFYGFF